jgi:hypothetical protein
MNTLRNRPIHVSFATHEEDAAATAAYWKSKTPRERLEALALLRSQKHKTVDGTRPRIQRVCRVIDVPWG